MTMLSNTAKLSFLRESVRKSVQRECESLLEKGESVSIEEKLIDKLSLLLLWIHEEGYAEAYQVWKRKLAPNK